MPPDSHPLFRRFPLCKRVQISTGEVPSPYHIYNGHGILVGGVADLATAQELLASEKVVPVQTADGKALMAIWLYDFTDASLGPHHELQFSIFVTPRGLPPVQTHPLGILKAMLTRPEIMMLCSGLWNNTPQVVAYNRELLSLDARLSRSRIVRDASLLTFDVSDAHSAKNIFSGKCRIPNATSVSAGWSLFRSVGFRKLWHAARQPWLRARVVNPVGIMLSENQAADAFTRVDVSRVRFFDAAVDEFNFGDTRYAKLKFGPQFIQWMDGFKFVYMQPRKLDGQNDVET